MSSIFETSACSYLQISAPFMWVWSGHGSNINNKNDFFTSFLSISSSSSLPVRAAEWETGFPGQGLERGGRGAGNDVSSFYRYEAVKGIGVVVNADLKHVEEPNWRSLDHKRYEVLCCRHYQPSNVDWLLFNT